MTRAARAAARHRGEEAEETAARYLARHGLEVVARNYRTRVGEIDIVAREAATLVFVEVRARTDARHGGAAASVGAAKRASLVLAARHYLLRFAVPPPCRFDVVAIEGGALQWLRGAFDAA